MITTETTKTPARPEPVSPVSTSPMTERIRRNITEDNVCVLTFDRPDSAANIFDRDTLDELGRHLDVIAASPNLKGVVLTSAKPAIFIAGADLGSISISFCINGIRHNRCVETRPTRMRIKFRFG